MISVTNGQTGEGARDVFSQVLSPASEIVLRFYIFLGKILLSVVLPPRLLCPPHNSSSSCADWKEMKDLTRIEKSVGAHLA